MEEQIQLRSREEQQFVRQHAKEGVVDRSNKDQPRKGIRQFSEFFEFCNVMNQIFVIVYEKIASSSGWGH